MSVLAHFLPTSQLHGAVTMDEEESRDLTRNFHSWHQKRNLRLPMYTMMRTRVRV